MQNFSKSASYALYRKSDILTSCNIPADWKIASVSPIFKPGDCKKISNYRLTSILPLISKIIEKLLHTRIYAFLVFFGNNQTGFRPRMGVNDSISTFFEYNYNIINNK